jgi:amino acid transporter
MPAALATTNRRGVPVVSTIVAMLVGCIALGPFKSWAALVNVVTGCTAIMYGFAPISLAALHRVDAKRPRSYVAPAAKLTLPAAFCSANLIIYWGGFQATWKIVCAMLVGFVLFGFGALRQKTGALRTLKHAAWMVPWLGGHVLIGWLGRYGGGREILADWIDILVVVLFSVVIFYVAVAACLDEAAVSAAVAKDAQQLELEPVADAA